eukprot:Mrub_13106.p1 GENE.Mrub_13106~~Mrub_13106.p1  ORF type:complete len:158 (-),score=41.53 Mrub_13106:55-495(-)
MKEHIGLKDEHQTVSKQYDQIKLENIQKDKQIDEFKSMIKDLNSVVNNLNEQKIAQKDYIRILKKLDNMETDLDNLNKVADKICSNQYFEVENLFEYKQPKNWGEREFNLKDLDDLANSLNKLCSKLRNKISEYAAMQLGENCKLN